MHVYEPRQDVPATQIVDHGAGRRMIAGGGEDSPNTGTFDFDHALRQSDAARDINDGDVIQNQ